jgi:hypothetical protein
MVSRRPHPADGSHDARTRHAAATRDASARHATARTDNGGSARRATAPHHDDLGDRTISLELLLERVTGSEDESGRLRSSHRESGQSNHDRAGHAVESLWCAANLTNESHRCRLHFPSPSIFTAASLMCAASFWSAPLPYSIASLNKLVLFVSAVNLNLYVDVRGLLVRRYNTPRRQSLFTDRSVPRIYQLFGPSERSFVRKLYSNDCHGQDDEIVRL